MKYVSKIEPTFTSVKQNKTEVDKYFTRLIGAPEVATTLLSFQIAGGTRQVSFLDTNFVEKRRKLKSLEEISELQHGSRAAEDTFSRSRERQLKKLEHLRLEQKREVNLKPEYLVNRDRWLVNLSNTILDKDEEEVLKLGPKFAPAPKRIPYTDIAAGVEAATHKARLPSEAAEELTARVCAAVQKAPQPERNLTAQQLKAVGSLKKKRQSIVILKADKGNPTIVMNREEYHRKCIALLQPPTYTTLKKDPTQKIERKVLEVLKELKNEGVINKPMFERLRPTSSKAPRFYGLPKIHKPETPLRPIASAIGSPTYSLAKFVTSIISPLAGTTSSFVKNSKHFTEMISEESVNRDEVMVSFDVKSLFTNVRVGEALDVIHEKLIANDTLAERTALSPSQITKLLQICLRTTYFLYQEQYYEQKDGTAMGSPVSLVVANMFMEHIEERAIRSSPHPIRFWRRYVYDTFCFLSKSSVEEVQKHLNSVSPAIQFTVEKETDIQLPFLDVLVMRDEGEKLKTTVYRKKTHTDRYLPFHSYQAKANSVRSLMKRAHDLTSDQHLLKDELHHVQGVLKCNGCPKGFVRKYRVQHREEKEKKSEDDDEENKPLSTAKIPYIKGLSEEMRRILGEYKIRTVFRTTETLGRILRKVKDPTPPEERPGIV